jgi:hypothetical protein
MKKTKKQLNTKRLFANSIWIPILLAAFVLQTVGLVALWGIVHSEQQKLENQVEKEATDSVALNNAASMSAVVASLSDNAVYMPSIRLKLPLTKDTLQLLYSTRSVGLKGDQQTTDVDTRTDASFSLGTVQRLACTPVRLAFEAKPNPHNPHETVRATVALADGRTLHAYSFEDESCNQKYGFTGTDPVRLAALFNSATSY